MTIEKCYQILSINYNATDEQITSAYKKLAFKYHPDKNPHRVQWANEAMTQLNLAYAAVMSYRFKNESSEQSFGPERPTRHHQTPASTDSTRKPTVDSEILTNKFIKLRESAKDALYRYFQYNLQNIPLREKVSNRAIFNKIVFSLRASYHAIRHLCDQTDDAELLEHFEVFTAMIFNFYRASECLNIIDSYNNQYDVEAYRLYRDADEHLHQAHKEIFYDRHNRGSFKSSMAYSLVVQAEKLFKATLAVFPESTWAIETNIKLEYAQSLRKYIELFFTE